MAEGESTRITVSEDKLYRALGELELRLTRIINNALLEKAPQIQVDTLEIRVQQLEASRLHRAHIEADVEKMKSQVDSLERESLDSKAVKRAARFAIGSLGLAVVAAGADIVFIFTALNH